jgi:transcription initiation factor IIE alpha subunit
MESEDIETLRFLYGEGLSKVLQAVKEHSEEFSKHLDLKKAEEIIPFLFAYIINECGDYESIEIVKEFLEGEKQPGVVALKLGLSSQQVNRVLYKCELFNLRLSPRELSGIVRYIKFSLDKGKTQAKIREYINAKLEKIRDFEKKEGQLIYRCPLPNCGYSVSFEDAFDIRFTCQKHGVLLKEDKIVVPESYKKGKSRLHELMQYL